MEAYRVGFSSGVILKNQHGFSEVLTLSQDLRKKRSEPFEDLSKQYLLQGERPD